MNKAAKPLRRDTLFDPSLKLVNGERRERRLNAPDRICRERALRYVNRGILIKPSRDS